VLGKYAFSASNMTVEGCVSECSAKGYGVAGVEYSTQCFCDQAIGSGGTLVADGQCGMLCGGSEREYCGESSRLGIWSL
jgi:hypothetical protein